MDNSDNTNGNAESTRPMPANFNSLPVADFFTDDRFARIDSFVKNKNSILAANKISSNLGLMNDSEKKKELEAQMTKINDYRDRNLLRPNTSFEKRAMHWVNKQILDNSERECGEIPTGSSEGLERDPQVLRPPSCSRRDRTGVSPDMCRNLVNRRDMVVKNYGLVLRHPLLTPYFDTDSGTRINRVFGSFENYKRCTAYMFKEFSSAREMFIFLYDVLYEQLAMVRPTPGGLRDFVPDGLVDFSNYKQEPVWPREYFFFGYHKKERPVGYGTLNYVQMVPAGLYATSSIYMPSFDAMLETYKRNLDENGVRERYTTKSDDQVLPRIFFLYFLMMYHVNKNSLKFDLLLVRIFCYDDNETSGIHYTTGKNFAIVDKNGHNEY